MLLLQCFCLRESEKSCLISVVHNHLKSVVSIHISSSREHLDLQYVFSATFRSRENKLSGMKTKMGKKEKRQREICVKGHVSRLN